MCMISDPYAAGYTFARSAFTGGPTRDQKAVRTIYIYIYIYTDSEIIVLTRWGSLRLAPINQIYQYGVPGVILSRDIFPARALLEFISLPGCHLVGGVVSNIKINRAPRALYNIL